MNRLILLLALATTPLLSHAIEEPEYEVIKIIDKVEFRKYSPYVVAEVVLNTATEDAANQAFPILSGYIFGKNKGEKKFSMTAPVTQTAEPIRLEMAVPVTQATVTGALRVQFVLPRGVTLETAPEPIDPRVQLRLVAARTWAVIRYSGSWSKANYEENLGKSMQLRPRVSRYGRATTRHLPPGSYAETRFGWRFVNLLLPAITPAEPLEQ